MTTIPRVALNSNHTHGDAHTVTHTEIATIFWLANLVLLQKGNKKGPGSVLPVTKLCRVTTNTHTHTVTSFPEMPWKCDR